MSGAYPQALRYQALRGREGHARVVVLSVINEEFDALRHELGAVIEVDHTGVFTAARDHEPPQDSCYPFVLAQCHSRSNIPAGEATRRLTEQFRPEIFLLVGIAGGIQRPAVLNGQLYWTGPRPGDIVVGEYVHYADFTKNVAVGHFLRYFPIDHPAQFLIGTHARVIRYPTDGVEWYHDLSCERPADGHPDVHIGEIIAVESIAGDPGSQRQAEFLRHFDNAVAVDMESMGVGRTLHEVRDHVHYNPLWMCVRGVSDVVRSDQELNEALQRNPTAAVPRQDIDNNDERSLWKRYAACAAARYAARVLARLLRQPRPAVVGDPGASSYQLKTSQVTPAVSGGRVNNE